MQLGGSRREEVTERVAQDVEASAHADGPSRGFVALMASCMALGALAVDVVIPAFADIRTEYGFAPESTEPSRMITVFFVGLALGQIFYGPLSDRFGRKPLIYAGLVLYIGGAVVSSFVPTFSALLVCRFVWGFGAAGPRSLTIAMVRDSMHGEQMARVMSHIMAVFLLVPVLAPSIGTGLLAVGPWQLVLWVPATFAMIVGLWLTRLPETLPVARRRSISPAALGQALRAVVSTRETRSFLVAVTFLFAMLAAFLGSVELIVDDVYDRRELFPLLVGFVGSCLAGATVLSGRLVGRIGLRHLVRAGGVYGVITSVSLLVLAATFSGHPPLWAFILSVGIMLPTVAVLVPNCSTAAVAPLAHVAGMAAAVLGTISTGGGALVGSVVDANFDGTVLPYAIASFVCAVIAALAILSAGRTNATPPLALELVAGESSVTT
jgi:MFS transporter, DHA1 family, multidrug resistance protein